MRRARPWTAFMMVAVLSACGDDGDDPSTPDFTEETAEQVAEGAESVVDPLDASAELSSNLVNASFTIGFLGFGGGVSPMVPFEAARAARGMTTLRDLPRPSVSAPTGLLLPDTLMGVTLTWSVDSLDYVFSDMPGAPANGVRFIYYAIDPFTQYPSEPLTPLGYLELVDASTDDFARLEIDAVRTAGNVKVADYFVQAGITGNLQTTTLTLDSDGFIVGSGDQIDFDIHSVDTYNPSTSDFETSAAVSIVNDSEDAAISVDFVAEGDSAASVEDGTFSVTRGTLEAAFSYVVDANFMTETYTIDGGLELNGEEVVIFSGDANDPDFTRPDGSSLTAAEVNALQRVWVAHLATQLFVGGVLLPFILLMIFAGL